MAIIQNLQDLLTGGKGNFGSYRRNKLLWEGRANSKKMEAKIAALEANQQRLAEQAGVDLTTGQVQGELTKDDKKVLLNPLKINNVNVVQVFSGNSKKDKQYAKTITYKNTKLLEKLVDAVEGIEKNTKKSFEQDTKIRKKQNKGVLGKGKRAAKVALEKARKTGGVVATYFDMMKEMSLSWVMQGLTAMISNPIKSLITAGSFYAIWELLIKDSKVKEWFNEKASEFKEYITPKIKEWYAQSDLKKEVDKLKEAVIKWSAVTAGGIVTYKTLKHYLNKWLETRALNKLQNKLGITALQAEIAACCGIKNKKGTKKAQKTQKTQKTKSTKKTKTPKKGFFKRVWSQAKKWGGKIIDGVTKGGFKGVFDKFKKWGVKKILAGTAAAIIGGMAAPAVATVVGIGLAAWTVWDIGTALYDSAKSPDGIINNAWQELKKWWNEHDAELAARTQWVDGHLVPLKHKAYEAIEKQKQINTKFGIASEEAKKQRVILLNYTKKFDEEATKRNKPPLLLQIINDQGTKPQNTQNTKILKGYYNGQK